MGVGAFVLDRFENEAPTTSEVIVHLLQSEMSQSISLDAMRHVVPRHRYFKTVLGMATEQKTIELGPWEMGDFNIRSYGGGNGIPSAMLSDLNETKHQKTGQTERVLQSLFLSLVMLVQSTYHVPFAMHNQQSNCEPFEVDERPGYSLNPFGEHPLQLSEVASFQMVVITSMISSRSSCPYGQQNRAQVSLGNSAFSAEKVIVELVRGNSPS
jgi:hypothetical protein